MVHLVGLYYKNNSTFPFIKSIYKPTYALDKIQFMTSVELLQVLALGCHPQGIFCNKGM